MTSMTASTSGSTWLSRWVYFV